MIKKSTSIDYNALGIATLYTIFKRYNVVGFSDDIHIRADSSSGTVRKSMKQKNLPTDFILIVNVSGSMAMIFMDINLLLKVVLNLTFYKTGGS
ncbi:MAG: hypothetical protein ACR5LD_03680 [Symbiopectobacterium sp.]